MTLNIYFNLCRLVLKRRLILGPGRQINLHCRLMAVAIPWAHGPHGAQGAHGAHGAHRGHGAHGPLGAQGA